MLGGGECEGGGSFTHSTLAWETISLKYSLLK